MPLRVRTSKHSPPSPPGPNSEASPDAPAFAPFSFLLLLLPLSFFPLLHTTYTPSLVRAMHRLVYTVVPVYTYTYTYTYTA